MILVVDRIETAARHAAAEDVVESVRLELLDVLDRREVRRMDTTGRPFDPAWHTAVREVAVEAPRTAPGHTTGGFPLPAPALLACDRWDSTNAGRREVR